MPILSILFGVLLILLGASSYIATGMHSMTALIPSGFGLLFSLFGLFAKLYPTLRKHIMHAAVLVALVGTAGGLGMSIPKLLILLNGGAVTRPLAVWMQFIMGCLCLIFVGLSIKSFIDARRNRKYE